MIYNFGLPKAISTIKYLYDRYIEKITTYTVASIEETDKSSFDFATLEEALTFAENCSVIGGGAVVLKLGEGTHYFERDSYQPSVAGNDVSTYSINHTHFFWEGEGEDKTIVTFSPDVKVNGGVVFRANSTKFSSKNLTIDYAYGGAECTKNASFIRTENMYQYYANVTIKGLNKDDYATALGMYGNTYIYGKLTIDNFKYGVKAFIGVVSGFLYRPTFKNCKYDINNIAASGVLICRTPTIENVDNIFTHGTISKYNTFFVQDLSNKALPKNSYGVLADSSERPEMDGVPSNNSYLQLDIGKPIWYKGKNDEGNDIWIDAVGNEV